MTETVTTAGHLLPLTGGDWHVWRQLGLRGAGFPTGRVLELAAPAAAASADRLAAARIRAAARREEAVDVLRAELDALRENGAWDDLACRRPLLRAISRLNKGRLPGEAIGDRPEFTALAEAEVEAAAELAAARAAFDTDTAALSDALSAAAADPLFQEAIIWQNRAAFTTGISRLTRAGDRRRNVRRREHEALAAGYLQRYCVKNDSIGFFGPIGWGSFTEAGAPLRVDPGPKLLASREVYFEQWCLDALARSLGTDIGLRRWLAPRRLPSVCVEGTTLHRAGGPVRLPDAQVATLGTVLRLCDGTRTALEVCAEAAALLPGLTGEDQALGLLASMHESGLIAWDLELPLQPDPEGALRRQLERIGDEDLRKDALDRLARIEEARTSVRAAAGRAVELERALERLESTFTELTGTPPTRARGETYGARTLVYEDSRRAGTVELGPETRDALGPPLTLMLDSARWFTHRVAAGYREIFDRTYRELAADTPEVRVTDFWQAFQPLLLGRVQQPVEEAVAELQRRWQQILGPFDGTRHVRRTTAGLRAAVDERFAAPDTGWAGARHQCPDVMLAAESPEAVARGDYQLVLGELHAGANTLRNLLFVQQHPRPQELADAMAADVPEGRVVPVPPKYWLYSTRFVPLLTSDKDHRLLISDEASWFTADEGALPVASLVVERDSDGAIVARDLDRGTVFDMVELLSDALSFKVVGRFQPMAPLAHTPRVSVDRLVISRETWRFHPAELPFAGVEDELEQFTAVRDWARGHGMPRFVFIKADHETKPSYVDFESPLFTRAFVRVVRAAPPQQAGARTSFTVSEMLPTAEQTWLADHQGHRFTSEFRIVAVDSQWRETPKCQ